jgi:hypothetical protein
MPHLLQLEGQWPGGKCLVYALQREICHEFWAPDERIHLFGYHTKRLPAISAVSSVMEDRANTLFPIRVRLRGSDGTVLVVVVLVMTARLSKG